jgi:hypothetical protein
MDGKGRALGSTVYTYILFRVKGGTSLNKFFHVVPVLRSGQHSCAMAHSAEPNPVLWPTAQNQTLCFGPERRTKSCAIAHKAEIFRSFSGLSANDP